MNHVRSHLHTDDIKMQENLNSLLNSNSPIGLVSAVLDTGCLDICVTFHKLCFCQSYINRLLGPSWSQFCPLNPRGHWPLSGERFGLLLGGSGGDTGISGVGHPTQCTDPQTELSSPKCQWQ
jgi:hypothetical protein